MRMDVLYRRYDEPRRRKFARMELNRCPWQYRDWVRAAIENASSRLRNRKSGRERRRVPFAEALK